MSLYYNNEQPIEDNLFSIMLNKLGPNQIENILIPILKINKDFSIIKYKKYYKLELIIIENEYKIQENDRFVIYEMNILKYEIYKNYHIILIEDNRFSSNKRLLLLNSNKEYDIYQIYLCLLTGRSINNVIINNVYCYKLEENMKSGFQNLNIKNNYSIQL